MSRTKCIVKYFRHFKINRGVDFEFIIIKISSYTDQKIVNKCVMSSKRCNDGLINKFLDQTFFFAIFFYAS